MGNKHHNSEPEKINDSPLNTMEEHQKKENKQKDIYKYNILFIGGSNTGTKTSLIKRIIEGIKFCHEKKICHLDIKCDNIMFDKEFNPIIIDFGFSEFLENESIKVQGARGYRSYKSPEMWEKDEFDGKKSDIFSLGAVLFNLVTGVCGFATSKQNDKYYKHIRNKNYEKYW